MDKCTELFLVDVCHVELVPAVRCTITVPVNADPQTEINNCIIGTPELTADINDVSGHTGLLESAPTLKTSPKTSIAGFLRQHDITIPTMGEYIDFRRASDKLAGADFHVILRTITGTEFLLYALPNTSVVAIEEQLGGDSKQTVKVSLQSKSNMIKMTRTEASSN